LNKEELDCIEEMKNTLINIPGFYHKNSLGISANQVGVSKRIILLSKFPRNRILQYKFFNVIINPKILEISKEKILKWEGCLSDEKYS
jgi:peptide deformylase